MKSDLFTKEAHTPDITREQWLELRKTGIGGSDAGALAGLSKWESPFTVYCDKLSLVPEKEDSEAMRQGRDLEEYVAKRFCEKEGKKIKRYQYLLRSKKYPFATANVDRVIVGENALLECKTTSLLNKTDFESGNIPEYWYCQCQHYLAVTGCDRCYLAVAVLGKAYYCFIIERNEADIAALMTIEANFWNENVLKQIEPTPDGSERAGEAIKQLYGWNNESDAEVDLEPYSKNMEEYLQIGDQIKALTSKQEQIKQEIQLYLKDSSGGRSGGYKVIWKTQESRRIDSKKLQKELPDVYEKYCTKSVSRPFKLSYKEII